MKKEIWLENRPNRNVASIDQTKEDGYEIDDNGEFAENLENEIDAELALSRLPKQQKRAAQLKLEGYNVQEIADKMGLSAKSVYNYLEIAKKTIGNFSSI
jgi:RNA polymerase sigma factor (sigma-70 family)